MIAATSAETGLFLVAIVLAVLVAVLVAAVVELARQLASRSPLDAAQAKRIAAGPPRKRQNVEDELTDSLSIGV